MVEVSRRPRSRTDRIADAAITVLTSDGERGLTHRAVDRAAGLPEGSTSYYCRTRRSLLELIVARLASRSADDTGRHPDLLGPVSPADQRVDRLTEAVGRLIEDLAARSEDMRARYQLLLTLSEDDPLRHALAGGSSVRGANRDALTRVLAGAGVEDAPARAEELMDLVDGLVFARVVHGASRPRTRAVVGGYLRGVIAR